MIRNARMEDIKTIYDLLNHYSDKGLLLGRSLSSLYDQLRDFKVCEEKHPETGIVQVAGVCALHVCWENLAEIRSLAVHEAFHETGIGTKLIKACLHEAEEFGITRVFTLTYQPGFFQKNFFRPINKNELPHKVWSDCINCPKFPDCNEEALIWEKSNYAKL